MHMRGQDERHFRITVVHDDRYRFISQASEDGRKHGAPYASDEPDPVGDASGPSTPALLGSAIGHCLSAALLEALRNARVEIEGIETEVVCVVRRGAIGLPRIARIDIVLKPTVAEVSESVRRCAESYEKHCTVTSSVREGIDIQVAVDWQALKEPAG